jgi:carbamoylphosphate synthase small subunit
MMNCGMRVVDKNVFLFNTIEASGPHDSSYLFDQFIENLKG